LSVLRVRSYRFDMIVSFGRARGAGTTVSVELNSSD
jgi:hypothetical protein